MSTSSLSGFLAEERVGLGADAGRPARGSVGAPVRQPRGRAAGPPAARPQGLAGPRAVTRAVTQTRWIAPITPTASQEPGRRAGMGMAVKGQGADPSAGDLTRLSKRVASSPDLNSPELAPRNWPGRRSAVRPPRCEIREPTCVPEARLPIRSPNLAASARRPGQAPLPWRPLCRGCTRSSRSLLNGQVVAA